MTLWMESKGAKTSHQSSRRTCQAFAQLHAASLLLSDQHTGTGRLFYWVDLHAASLLSSDQHTGTGRLFYWVDLQAAHKTRALLSKTEKNDMLLLCQHNGKFCFQLKLFLFLFLFVTGCWKLSSAAQLQL